MRGSCQICQSAHYVRREYKGICLRTGALIVLDPRRTVHLHEGIDVNRFLLSCIERKQNNAESGFIVSESLEIDMQVPDLPSPV